MRWAQVRDQRIPYWIVDRVDELRHCGERAGHGIRWQWERTSAPSGSQRLFMPGWCGGSAGLVHLWSLAHALTANHEYVEIAIATASSAWAQETMAADLCCGAAGRAYAMLTIWRLTGERKWLNRARRLADRAIERFQSRPRDPALGCTDGLMRGAGGIAVLLEELASPAWARMPVIEAEPWPVTGRVGASGA
jgi:eukaryotic-like serine/threonine-protein kinase